MKKILTLALLLPSLALSQTGPYNLFKPANGILKGQTTTYVTTAATSADVDGLYASPVALTGTDINTSGQVTATHLSGPLPATQGGSGQTTITVGDLLYGSASNVLSKLAGNTTTTKQFLSQTGNGTISAAPAWGALAAADIQGLAPVWTQNQEISDSEPRYILTNTGQGADLKKWDLDLAAGVLCFRTRTDADGAGQNVLCATRGTTTALTNITLGYSGAATYTFPFTGTASFSGALTGTRYGFSGTISASSNSMYSPATNTIGISTNGTERVNISTTAVTINTAINAPNLATSSAATTGTMCWTSGTGLVNVDTTTTCLLSSRRYKKDILPLNEGLSAVMKLHPVSYELQPKYDPSHIGGQIGLIAEDVDSVDPRLVSREEDGRAHAVRYQQLTALLIKAIQEQQAEIDALKRNHRNKR